MKLILDVTDTKTRLLQQGAMAGCFLLAALVVALFYGGALPAVAAIVLGAVVVVLFAVAAGIKQRWEVAYRGHRIRLENSPVSGERLFLDEGLVAKGGVGMKVELRAPIRVGEGAGETIVALVDAGVREFRLRLFVEGEAEAGAHIARPIEPMPPARPDASPGAAVEPGLPVTESVMLGRLRLAKYALELLASVIGGIGGLIAIATWLS